MSLNEKIYTDLYLDYYNGKLKFDGTKIEEDTNGDEPFIPFVNKFQHKFLMRILKRVYFYIY